jgi:hypothetical protein
VFLQDCWMKNTGFALFTPSLFRPMLGLDLFTALTIPHRLQGNLSCPAVLCPISFFRISGMF